jgi:hypothetical protein
VTDIRGHNLRYNLRRRARLSPPASKVVPQRKVKPTPRRPVIAEPQDGFPQFSRLPQEIRLKIWDIVTNEPRAVIIHSSSGDPYGGFRSPTPIPAALHTCLESRELALKKYELTFSARDVRGGLDYPARIWFNFEQDMVYFRHPIQAVPRNFWRFQSSVVTKNIERIRFLGIDIQRSHGLLPHYLDAWKALKVCYYCHESARLDVERSLILCPPRRNHERAFVRQYRWRLGKDGRFKGLSLSSALQKIKQEAISLSWFQGNRTLEVHLVTVANS